MNIDFTYRPMPIHAPFHRSAAHERALFGAFGSGKTYAICAEAIAWCLEQPGIRGLITRKTIPELRDTTETVFFEILPHELYQAGEVRRMGGHVERFIFPNGATVLFRSIDDWNKHKSLNVGFIGWDEADEFDEETYLGMSSRVRQKEPTPEGQRYGATQITKRGMWCASNPAGHNWLYRRFVDPATQEKNTDWFRSTSFDNPHLPPEYIESLLQYPDQWVRRYVLCQFDDFAGQVYEEWGWDTHVVEPFKEYAPGAVFWMGFDPGQRVPSAGLWVHVDPSTRIMTGVAEYLETNLAASRHAAEWRKIEGDLKIKPAWRVADPAIMRTDLGSNMTVHSQYRRLGFNFALGPQRHQDRIPMLGQLIHLNRFKVTRECPQTYEAIKNYQWEDITPTQRTKGADPPERPLKSDDHPVDCAQYLASRLVTPMGVPLPRKKMSFSDEVHRTIKRQQLRKARSQRLPSPVPGTVV